MVQSSSASSIQKSLSKKIKKLVAKTVCRNQYWWNSFDCLFLVSWKEKKSVWAEICQKNCVLRSAIEELWAIMPSMQVNKINILSQFISIETKKLGVWNTFINCNQEGAVP